MSGTGVLGQLGAACFGIAVGYLTYRALVRTAVNASISVLAAVVGAVGGAAVTGLFAPGTAVFAWYAIGLLAGMAVCFAVFGRLSGLQRLATVLSGRTEAPGDIGPGQPQAEPGAEEVR
jgi:hypothetical protein